MSRVKHLLSCHEAKGYLVSLVLKKRRRSMSQIQCYGCQGYGHYKSDYPKLKKDNNKRRREDAHITEEVEEAEKNKFEEVVKDLYCY